MKKIVENPPNVPFIGKQLSYKKTRTEPITGSHKQPELKHSASYPADLSNRDNSLATSEVKLSPTGTG